MATNTLGGVNSTRIAQLTLDALQTTVLPFSAFTTSFSSEVAQMGNAVTTRYVTNPSVVSFATTRSSANSTTTAVTVTLNNYVGIDIGFSDTEMSFSDVQLSELYIKPAITALFENVMANTLALVVNANFTNNTVISAANFTAANIANVATSLSVSKVGVNRHIICSPTYAETLRKDSTILPAYAIGDPNFLKMGVIPMVHGFKIHEYNGTIPTTENLAAIALAPQAIAIAARVPVTPRNWAGSVTNITDPASGLTVQYRDWYDGTEQRSQFCLIYGTAKGNPGNLRRILSV
jgi:hypothetical protein